MKKITLLFLVFLFLAFSVDAQSNKRSYVIEGKTPGLNEGTVYISEFINSGERDSAVIRKGHFRYEGKSENPIPVLLRVKGNQGSFLFFAENKKMQVMLDKDSLKNSVVTGSAVNKDYQLYEQKIKSQNDRLIALSNWSRSRGKLDEKTQDSVSRVWEAIDEERKAAVNEFIKEKRNSIVAAYAITRHFMTMPDVAALDAQYSSLDPKVQQTTFGKQIKEKLDIEKVTAVGKMAPEFSQKDTAGNIVFLNNYRGKYILLDFWASWCGPCRKENPLVVAAYNKYRDKGFDILAVSLDGKKEAWLKAISQDGLTWTHVSELDAWNNSAAKLYGVNAIPSNFLLDPSGVIIAKNLNGQKLQEKLAEVLK